MIKMYDHVVTYSRGEYTIQSKWISPTKKKTSKCLVWNLIFVLVLNGYLIKLSGPNGYLGGPPGKTKKNVHHERRLFDEKSTFWCYVHHVKHFFDEQSTF